MFSCDTQLCCLMYVTSNFQPLPLLVEFYSLLIFHHIWSIYNIVNTVVCIIKLFQVFLSTDFVPVYVNLSQLCVGSSICGGCFFVCFVSRNEVAIFMANPARSMLERNF